MRQLPARLRRLAPLRLEALEPGLVLVHLAELAVAPVALDELLLAGDLLGLRLDVLDRPRVALDRAGGGRRCSRRGTRSAAGRAAPRSRSTVASRNARSCDATRSEPARRRRCSSSHSSASRSRWLVGSSRSSRSGSAMTRRASDARVCSPPDSADGGLAHSSRVKPETGQRARRRAGRGCSRRGPRTGAGARRRRGSATRPSRSMRGQRARPSGRGGRRRSGPPSAGPATAMNASSKWASWASSPRVRPRLRWTSPRSGSSRPAASRSSVVLPAPFGPTRPIRSPSAIEASIASRMTNVPTSRVTPVRRRMLIGRSAGGPGAAADARAAARRVAAARFVRSVRARVAAARGLVRRQPERPLPRQLGPAAARPAAGRRSSSAGSPPRPCGRPRRSRWHHEQKWVDRAPTTIRLIGRPQRGHGSPVRW